MNNRKRHNGNLLQRGTSFRSFLSNVAVEPRPGFCMSGTTALYQQESLSGGPYFCTAEVSGSSSLVSSSFAARRVILSTKYAWRRSVLAAVKSFLGGLEGREALGEEKT
jgi:hypothetical protein